MRTALTILVIVALVLVALGAVNHAVTLDLDFLALSWTDVSLFWLSVVFAAVVVAAGVAGAWAARGSAVAAQRRLEKELGKTYKRLREAQAAVDSTAVAPVTAAEDTALAPAPPEPVPDGAYDATVVSGPTDVTAVTKAVSASSVAGWDEVAGAVQVGDDEAPQVTGGPGGAVVAPGTADERPAGVLPVEDESGEDATALMPEPPAAAGSGADATAVTTVVPGIGEGVAEAAVERGETPGGEASEDVDPEAPASTGPSAGLPRDS